MSKDSILLDDFRNAVGSKVQRNFRSGSRKWNSVLGLTIDKKDNSKKILSDCGANVSFLF